MDDSLEYESFLRWAFGLQRNIHVDRWGDPAQVADTDFFAENNLEGVKAATAYAMLIYKNDIVNKYSDIPSAEYERLKNFVVNVVRAESVIEVSGLITGFNESFVDRFYIRENGSIIFRSLDL